MRGFLRRSARVRACSALAAMSCLSDFLGLCAWKRASWSSGGALSAPRFGAITCQLSDSLGTCQGTCHASTCARSAVPHDRAGKLRVEGIAAEVEPRNFNFNLQGASQPPQSRLHVLVTSYFNGA